MSLFFYLPPSFAQYIASNFLADLAAGATGIFCLAGGDADNGGMILVFTITHLFCFPSPWLFPLLHLSFSYFVLESVLFNFCPYFWVCFFSHGRKKLYNLV